VEAEAKAIRGFRSVCVETQKLCCYSLLVSGNKRDRIAALTQCAEKRLNSRSITFFPVIRPKITKLQPFETKLR